MKFLNRKLAVVAGLAIAGVMAASSLMLVQAAEFIVPNENGNVTVSADEQHRDLYVVGGNVLVNSNTAGDLYVAGGNVTVEGNVEGDLTIAGGNVYVNGTVGGDVRAAGGTLNLNDTIGGDLVAAGGTIILNEKAAVSGDLYLAGGEMSLLGAVTGTVRVNAEKLTVNSSMTGNAEFKVIDRMVIGSKAVFGNTAKYKSIQEAQVENGATLGSLQFERMDRNEMSGKHRGGFVAGILTLGFVIKLLAVIVTALVLYKLFTKSSQSAVQDLGNNFWMNLLIGLIVMIVAPIVSVLLMLSIVGFYIALLLLVTWILFCLVACLLGTVFIGAWLVKILGKKPELVVDWQAIVIGVVVVGIVSLIPVIGWLISIILILAALGTLVRALYGRINHNQDKDSAHSQA